MDVQGTSTSTCARGCLKGVKSLQEKYMFYPIAFWLASLFLIQILGSLAVPDSSTMPDECSNNSENCARDLIFLEGSPESVHSAAVSWIRDYSQTNIKSLDETSSHTVFRTKWMTFPDDFYLEAGCSAEGTWLVAHSESRLGRNDFNANADRISELFDYMQGIEFEPYNCD